MKSSHNLLKLILVFTGFCRMAHAQDYYVTYLKDTVFCSNLVFYAGSSGKLIELTYTDTKGKKVEITKKKNLQHIHTLHMNDTIYDWMPLKTKKPMGYHRFGKRLVNGKLKVNHYSDVHSITNYDPNYSQHPEFRKPGDTPYGTSKMGTWLLQITMPDGIIYKVNKKNIKKIIKPYLLQCPAFREKYTGSFSPHMQEFISTIQLYNSLCK